MKLDEVVAYAHNLGPIGFAKYTMRRSVNNLEFVKAPYRLNSRYTNFPLWCRPGTSDLSMFAEVICHRAFRCLDPIKSAQLILDCGANVGYSSAYFLSRYPESTVIAIEPDTGNFGMLERNLIPYGDRYHGICSAIWSHSTGMVLSQERLGAGDECARTVRPVRTDEKPDFMAIDIGTILDRSGFDRISILKVDIEGAERIVFESNYERWLSRVDSLVIELHSQECIRVFQKASAHENFEISACDDQVVCLRKTLAGHERANSVAGPIVWPIAQSEIKA
jgi:FkbM family methyltransferase